MSNVLEVEASLGEGVRVAVALEEVEAAVLHVLRAEGVASAEISIAFLDDHGISRMNEGYLSHEGATDVISFALHGEGERPLGDVYVGADQAERQAAEEGVDLREEMLRLAIHGTLHVLGYDHPASAAERQASEMYARQESLLASFLEQIGPAGR